MLLDTQLIRIQRVVKVSELVSYLVNEIRIVRLAAKSRLLVLLKKGEVDLEDPKYN